MLAWQQTPGNGRSFAMTITNSVETAEKLEPPGKAGNKPEGGKVLRIDITKVVAFPGI